LQKSILINFVMAEESSENHEKASTQSN